jgi:hypothetical protein
MMTDENTLEKEPAEGSRENLNVPAAADMETGAGQLSEPHEPAVPGAENPRHDKGGSAQPGAGITNRPIEEERLNQEGLPARGKTKGEDEGEG